MGDISLRGNRLTFAKGGRTGFKHGTKPWGTGPKPGSHDYLMQQLHKPRKKKAIGSIVKGGRGITKILERLGGGEEGKPHSTKAGRIAAGARKIKRIFNRKLPKPADWKPIPQRPKRPPWKPHGGVGGPMVKAEGGRIGLKHGSKPWGTGPKPGSEEYWMQQVHKPRKRKAVGGAVKIGKRFLDFIKTGKHVDKSGVKVNVPKAAERLTGKPHVDHGKRKRIKHLGRGKAEGGRIGRAAGGWIKHIPERKGPRGGHPGFTKESMYEHAGGGEKGKPHSSKEGRIAGGKRYFGRQRERVKKLLKRHRKPTPTPQPLAKGGKADKNWIQKAVNPKHKGYCTPMTKKTCTPARKALARTFKKKAKTGWS